VGANLRQLLCAKATMTPVQAQTRASGEQQVLALWVPVHTSRHCWQTDGLSPVDVSNVSALVQMVFCEAPSL
jgi:hypothetical protein